VPITVRSRRLKGTSKPPRRIGGGSLRTGPTRAGSRRSRYA